MRIRFLAAAGLVALFAVASCDRPDRKAEAPPAATAPAFSHEMSGDLSGYYMPASEVRIGKWSFDHIFVGQAHEFQAWEGGDRSETFGPVMLQFDDVTSPMVQTEIGEARSVTARVLPTAYTVTDNRISFEGRSAELGAVRFEGALDPGALATARRNLGDEGVVVTGRLTVGDAPAQNVQLRWWAGD
ncbi:hypothetical protein [Brevundimonas sp.]|uniref:hypothetical protein n=1 Tax=Brevundimonas sp. TaxID=1871086 RepID=UPI0017916D55|nr:hypothetical protein [Brevundimonas sp.]MBA3048249.1 hypothetical protein [Brevundimonas sp.]